MADYTELIRCLRDCCGFPTETDYTCDCDNCLMKDKIVEHTDEDGEPFFTDYTECESALGLAAADAIEQLQKDLERSKEYEAFWEKEANEALRRFQVAIASKPRWIPVTERCPEKSGDYLVFDDCRNLYVNEWHCLLKKWQYDDSRITHWMPLPTPPKEDEA